MDERIPVSRLRGLKVLFEDDLYELAQFKLKVHLAQDTPTQTTRTTVHGLIQDYGYLAEINARRVHVLAEKHGLALGAAIEPDGE